MNGVVDNRKSGQKKMQEEMFLWQQIHKVKALESLSLSE